MDTEGFVMYLKRGGRSPDARQRVLKLVNEFEEYLILERKRRDLDDAAPDDLECYVAWTESVPKKSAKTHLWAVTYYYRFSANQEMAALASLLRQERIKRKPFNLKDFRGVDQDSIAALEAVGIKNTSQMLKAGTTPTSRQELAEKTDVPPGEILELVKLSDLARIPGVKGIRARLYHDAGVDTVEEMAAYEAEDLLEATRSYVEKTGFDGVPPLPAEAQHSIKTARSLATVVEYVESDRKKT